MRKNSKKRFASFGVASILIGGGALGTLAYLTDAETTTNTVTIGNIKADLEEPNWPGNDSDDVKNLVPNQVVPKDPMVENTGVNDFITFVVVESPVRNVTKVADDGTKGTKQNQEIFYFQKAGTAQNVEANAWNTSASGWVELASKETGTDMSAAKRTYVFGYATKLEGSANDGSAQTAANKVTSKLFDQIQLKNVLENELVGADATQDIKVTTYCIQASEIMAGGASALDTSSAISAENLGKIYDIYVNQHGTGSEPQADSNNAKDLEGNDRS